MSALQHNPGPVKVVSGARRGEALGRFETLWYWCPRCEREHRRSSKIGQAHDQLPEQREQGVVERLRCRIDYLSKGEFLYASYPREMLEPVFQDVRRVLDVVERLHAWRFFVHEDDRYVSLGQDGSPDTLLQMPDGWRDREVVRRFAEALAALHAAKGSGHRYVLSSSRSAVEREEHAAAIAWAWAQPEIEPFEQAGQSAYADIRPLAYGFQALEVALQASEEKSERQANNIRALYKQRRKAEIALQASEEERERPPFNWFVEVAQNFLAQYPADVFDGSSGDPGPLFVVALRQALADLRTEPPDA